MNSRLDIAGLAVAYRNRTILDAVAADAVQGGGLVALVGPNGAGKSTLLRAIAGLVRSRGRIVVDGVDLNGLSLRDRSRIVAYMPQTLPNGVALTVLETVIAALLASPAASDIRSESDAAATAVAQLRAIGAEDLVDRRLDELSGGQRQIAALAQALVRRPRLLLLDEPTSALDLRRQHQVLDLARDHGRTAGAVVMVVLHDLQAAARIADRVIVIDHGRIAADGPPALALSPERLATIWGVAARIETCSRGSVQIMVDGIL